MSDLRCLGVVEAATWWKARRIARKHWPTHSRHLSRYRQDDIRRGLNLPADAPLTDNVMALARDRLGPIATVLAGFFVAASVASAAEPAVDGSRLRALAPIKNNKSVKDTGSDGIRVVGYSSTKQTSITGEIGEPVTIVFPSSESISRIVQTRKPNGEGGLSEESAWWGPMNKASESKEQPALGNQQPALGNQLPLWPASVGTTTMTVTTCAPDDQGKCKFGTQKPYYFHLTAVPHSDGQSISAAADRGILFKGGAPISEEKNHVLSVGGSDDPPAPRKPTPKRKRQNEAQLAAAQEKLRTDSFNHASGCHYQAQGPATSPIIPRCALDNGIWTIMRFPGLSQKPAIYITDQGHQCGVENGRYERLARQFGKSDLVIVEELAPRFCLRLGGNVLQVDNLAYNPVGNPTDTGTIAPTVDRQIIKAAK